MKVLLFANTDWHVLDSRQSLARTLRAAGHEVLLVSPSAPPRREVARFGLPLGSCADMVRRSLNPLRECAFVQWLRRLIEREGVQLVHGFRIKCVAYGSIAARLAGAPARVNAAAGMGYVFASSTPLALLIRLVLMRAHA